MLSTERVADLLKAFTELSTFDKELFDSLLADPLPDPILRSVRTYEEADVKTDDAGFVITADDGSEYQVTVVRSK